MKFSILSQMTSFLQFYFSVFVKCLLFCLEIIVKNFLRKGKSSQIFSLRSSTLLKFLHLPPTHCLHKFVSQHRRKINPHAITKISSKDQKIFSSFFCRSTFFGLKFINRKIPRQNRKR